MRFLLVFLLSCLASSAWAQSTTILPQYQTAPGVNTSVSMSTPLPVGVYAGAGATSGKVLTSNGVGSLATFQPAAGGGGTVTSVTFTGDGTVLSSTPSSAVTTTGTLTATLATQTANTLLGATSTTLTNLAVPSCSGATSALTWTTSTGFGCNTISYSAGAVGTQTSNYTLVLGDQSNTVLLSSGSAITATIPPNASVAFPVGAQVVLIQYGAGASSLVAGAGVTIDRPSTLNFIGQYSIVMVIKIATNEWIATGALQ